MVETLTVLGIESSCDDTAAAIVRVAGAEGTILSNIVEGQNTLHAPFGGVVPEIAARAHAERVDHCVEAALTDAELDLRDIDLIAVTSGPGLIGGVLSGVMCAQGVAAGAGLGLGAGVDLDGPPTKTIDDLVQELALLDHGGNSSKKHTANASRP